MSILFAFVLSICVGSACTGVKSAPATEGYNLHYLGDEDQTKDGLSDSAFINGYKILKTVTLQESNVKSLCMAIEKAKEQYDIVKTMPFFTRIRFNFK